MRIGLGFDVHPLVAGRRLVLGGVEIPFGKGLGGWSDGDVLTHAIIDALLGAAGLGDIGQYFPPGEAEYRDISSLILLARVRDELRENGWEVGNIDANVLAEQPKLRDFIEEIRQELSRTLAIAPDRVSIKAKTANGLGPIGQGEGIGAQAIALIEGADFRTV
ncbi:MAG: 2-C-methyl-D-erythritol 2,4-cyclodiphosphate synthase [Chloroflexi bacterium]|nr:2-C-methyl-D-erythritol 2,4-cyclodiphosphate synthase [Chloroflexota bacterium]